MGFTGVDDHCVIYRNHTLRCSTAFISCLDRRLVRHTGVISVRNIKSIVFGVFHRQQIKSSHLVKQSHQVITFYKGVL